MANSNFTRKCITSIGASVSLDCGHEFKIIVAIPGANMELDGVYCPTCLSEHELIDIEPETV
jgi:hypothetical protein